MSRSEVTVKVRHLGAWGEAGISLGIQAGVSLDVSVSTYGHKSEKAALARANEIADAIRAVAQRMSIGEAPSPSLPSNDVKE